jgi:hypothetical protein
MRKKNKIFIFMGLIALVGAILLFFSINKPQAFQIENIEAPDEFPDRNIIAIHVDSLSHIIKLVYGNDAHISLPDSTDYLVKIQNQGNEISNFYNDNPKLLVTKDSRFAIKRIQNKLEASFNITVINQQKYAFVPTDVVYKLSELAYNK